MRIGIITWWRNNYGSILQALALQHELSQINEVDYEIICQFGKKAVSLDNFMDKLRNVGIRETLKRAFWKTAFSGLRHRNKKIQKIVDEFLVVSSIQYTENTIAESNQEYDAFICGSDQIWNVDLVSLDSMYWLGFVEKGKRKIAYAPSIGIKSLTEEQKKQIKRNLSTFNAISCRECSGTTIINELTNSNSCCTVLDPTLLVDRSFWDTKSHEKVYKEKYIFTYMLRGTKKQRKDIESFAQKRHLKILTIPFLDYEKIVPYDIKFGDEKLWDSDPFEFISAIRYADFVFCDSFHCMVFSLLYHKEFYVFPKIGNDGKIKMSQISRMVDLLNAIGIIDRIIIDNIIPEKQNPINWQRVDVYLEKERIRSKGYLFKALS